MDYKSCLMLIPALTQFFKKSLLLLKSYLSLCLFRAVNIEKMMTGWKIKQKNTQTQNRDKQKRKNVHSKCDKKF